MHYVQTGNVIDTGQGFYDSTDAGRMVPQNVTAIAGDATQWHVVRIEARDPQGAHQASLRAQAIVAALRESLNLSTGEVANRLDGLYAFMLQRLVAGNLAKDPAPAREVIGLLRELLVAWRVVATPARTTVPLPAPAPAGTRPSAPDRSGLRVGVSGAA